MKTPASNEREIQRADPGTRRLAIRVVALGALAGVAWIASLPELERALGAWLARDPARSAERARAVVAAIGLALALPLLLGALRAWRLGRRTLAAERFPPPGFKGVRDTPVRLGAEARRMGRALRAIAVTLAAAALLLLLLFLRLASRLA